MNHAMEEILYSTQLDSKKLLLGTKVTTRNQETS